MSTTVVLPQGTYPPQSRTLGPVAIPVGVSRASLDLDGVAMTDPALRLTVQLDLSLDSGVTWASTNRGPATDPFPVVAEMQGGATNRDGSALTTYNIFVAIPASGSTTRHMRAQGMIAGASLTTQGTLTLT